MIGRFTTSLLFFYLTITFNLAAQAVVTGKVINKSDATPLPGTTVILLNLRDSTSLGTATDPQGQYALKVSKPGRYLLKISFIGFQPYQKNILVRDEAINIEPVFLSEDFRQLKEIQITGDVVPVVQKGDTTQFNAGAYKTNPDANAEDLIRKMPGVDMSSGTLKTQGEDVRKVLVDGKQFFGDDPNAALRNLPAEVISQIQIYDEQSEQSQFTGFNDGQTSKTMNIITRADRREGLFGRLYGGFGTDERYHSGGNINIFNGDRRMSIVGLSNNINIQNFSSEDLVGISGSGGQRGRGMGGRGGGGGSNARDFLVGQQNGISTTHAIGLNYADKWGKKTDVTGSYFFNSNSNTATEITNREYVLPSDSGQYYQENSFSTSTNKNHRFNLRIDYKIDSFNSILIRPRLSLQQNNGGSELFAETTQGNSMINKTQNRYRSDLTGLNFNNDILFRHRFKKEGRTFSIGLNGGINNNTGESILMAENIYFDSFIDSDTINQSTDIERNTWSMSGNVSYTEPVGKNSLMRFNYEVSSENRESDKSTFQFSESTGKYDVLDQSLSNIFSSNFIAQRIGTSYMYRKEKYQMSFGANYQYAELNNQQEMPVEYKVTRYFKNILPTAMVRYRFSKTRNLNASYRTSTNVPSVEQLQNVINNSNPLQLSMGNPDLQQTYQHNVTVRYSTNNTQKITTFFAMLSGSVTDNFITNSSIIAVRDSILADGIVLQRGSRLSQPVNLENQLSLRSFASYGIPVSAIKSNVNLNGSSSYSRTPGLVNNVLNYSNSYNFGLGFTISSNFSQKLDFTISSSSNYSVVKNSLQENLNNNYLNQISRASLNWIFWKGIVFSTDVNHNLNTGLSEGFNQNFILWNMGLGKKLFKKEQGEIKVSVYDLLKQNNSIRRNVTEIYIEDQQTDVLQRYFMATFTYNLRYYKK